ncbi:MAG: PQQ-binding-like beta-propeller repeat protein [Fuerstiella sp.]|nr:PQQ-binding-like beta-propeller repeat protein [Fuerstiella sp.]MDG2127133.1 PQQ-binding-like beta-propeller repeat protein [Fuerstiella sp.]
MIDCRRLMLLFAIQLSASVAANDCPTTSDWPQFRGHRASGVADGRRLPVEWDLETETNIRWQTEIPGMGHASPIVCRGCVYIVSASTDVQKDSLRVGLYGDIESVQDDNSYTWTLYCLSAGSGKICWARTVYEGRPQIKRHTKATHANSTPATNGRQLFIQLGSEGLYCYDLCGRFMWKNNAGQLDSGYYKVPAAQWGFGSSPIAFRNLVIVQCDVQKDSFMAAYNVEDGREMWRVPRDDVPTWSTPTIHDNGRRPVLIANGHKHAGGYDAMTGQELWRLSGGGDIPVPTPIVAHGLVFLSSAHGAKKHLGAIRTSARGKLSPDLSKSIEDKRVAWYESRDATYMQTPIVYGDYLYACRDNGVLSCYNAKTGKRLYRQRLGNGGVGFTASPVAGDGKLYFTSEMGDVFVVRSGAEFELLSKNSMGEICMATPAISDGMLIVRGKSRIYGIGEPGDAPIVHNESDSARYPNTQPHSPKRQFRLIAPGNLLKRIRLLRKRRISR